MVLFLLALCLSVFGLAVTALAFGAATRGESVGASAQPDLKPSLTVPLPAPRFLAEQAVLPPPSLKVPVPVPIEVLLLQIERHVRLEQAAAESFLDLPTAASLHSRTTSPLVH